MFQNTDALLQPLRDLLFKSLSQPCSIPGMHLWRIYDSGSCALCIAKPCISLILQGEKTVTFGANVFHYRAGELIVSALDLTSTYTILPVNLPFLAVSLDLERSLCADLIAASPLLSARPAAEQPSAVKAAADSLLIDAYRRLLQLNTKPEDCAVMAPLLKREIHYLLLKSAAGASLRAYCGQNAPAASLVNLIDFLKANFRQNLSIEVMAERAHMAASTLHRRFKAVTGLSPLQYQKHLRLNAARDALINHNISVAQAAFEVGYASVPQFCRDCQLPPTKVEGFARLIPLS